MNETARTPRAAASAAGPDPAAPPDISAVIVNYNTREVTARAVQSLLSHAGRLRIEVIVADNASSDGSVSALRAAHPGITVIDTGHNGGYAWGNNVGIHRARGRYVLVLNPDAEVFEGSLERAVDYMDAHPEVGILGARAQLEDGRRQLTVFRHPTLAALAWNILVPNGVLRRSRLFGDQRYASRPADRIMDADVVAGCFMLVPRRVIETVGPMDHRFFMYSEETEWCWRVRQAGFKVRYHPEVRILHRGAVSTGQTSPWKAVEIARSRLLLLRLTRGAGAARAGAALMLAGDLLRGAWVLPAAFGRGGRERARIWRARTGFLLGALLRLPQGQVPPPPEQAGRP
ncbi:glycosyltransferase family 2 protein (plasmid) [Roseobacteraceae bacterium NS-SX3]